MLQPLLAKNEREVRQHVVEWVEHIRRAPNLEPQTEERLVTILSQLIEQKFKTLSYKELTEMLRLTALEETLSGQELIKNERVAMLTALIQDRFELPDKLSETVRADLEKLNLEDLKLLIRQILHFDTFEALEQWIAKRLPPQPA